jgi:hypothetical protein
MKRGWEGEFRWWITLAAMFVAIMLNSAAGAVFLAWLWYTEGEK